MLKETAKQLSIYSELYNKIPEDHILKQINKVISFEFINKLLEASYCKNFGRPAKEPEMMLRILMLQYLYNLSDERVIEEIGINLAYMWFIGINPEDELPHPSLLAKFRTMRLKDMTLDDIIPEVVRQCIEKGIISRENGIAVDTTHIEANTTKKVPERVMKHLAKKIFKEMGQTEYDIPDYTQISDHKEAKRVMKEYLENLIEESVEAAPEAVAEAKAVLDSDLFIEQKGIRSLSDKDARVGNKSKTQQFFGYKAEVTMTTEGSLITAINVNPGSYVDGKETEHLYNNTVNSGLEINSFYGDKAYFRKDILDLLKDADITPYIPVSASSYKIDEENFSYNKDSDQWYCIMGNETVKRTTSKENRRGKESLRYEYHFNVEKCKDCPRRAECMGKSTKKGKVLRISENAPEFYMHSQWAKTDEFLTEYKKRAKIEPKNAEMKRFHGMARARGYGLKSVTIQAKLTALAVNLKRICKLISSLSDSILRYLQKFGKVMIRQLKFA